MDNHFLRTRSVMPTSDNFKKKFEIYSIIKHTNYLTLLFVDVMVVEIEKFREIFNLDYCFWKKN